MKQDTSGPAGRLAALGASLRLGFRRNSGEFRNQRNSIDTTNARGKGQRVMLFHHQGGSCTAVSVCFPLAAFQLPASCAGACLIRPWRSCGRLSGRRGGFGRPSSSWATHMHLAVKSPGPGETASPPQLPFGHTGEARSTTPEPELELRTYNSPGFRAESVESARGWCLRGGSIPLPGFLLRFESRLARRCRCFFSSH